MRLFDLLPEIYKDKQTEQFWEILQTAIDSIEISAEDIKNLIDIDKAREDWLVNISSNLGVDLSKDFPLSNRKRISKAIELHKLRGTKEGILLVLELLNLQGQVKEWFEYGGQPYRFKVELGITNKEITPQLRDKLLQLINQYKNERSWLDELILSYLAKANVYLSSGTMAETQAEAQMINGFEWQSKGTAFILAGSIGETQATAIMVEA